MFDPRSLIVISGLLATVCTVVLFSLRQSFPRSIGGISQWAWALVLFVVSSALFAGRGLIPDWLSIVVANTVLFGGTLLMYLGLRDLAGQPARPQPYVIGLAVLMLAIAWFSTVLDHYGVRTLLAAGVNAVAFGACAMVALDVSPGKFGGRFTSAAFMVCVVVLVTRMFGVLYRFDATSSILEPSLVQQTYLTIYPLCLLAAILGFILMINERLRQTLEHLASHDSMTGAFLRPAFFDRLESEVARARRHDRPFALLMLDLDQFKRINDEHGHMAGDKVIVDFAQRITALLRQQDMLCRYGGEEFVLLLPETSLANGTLVAERIRRNVIEAHQGVSPYTVSIGVVVADGKAANDANALLEAADGALYEAKRGGRNRVEVAAGT
ncbi:MAG: sensor domain-containing diguanylate cyclase [Rhodocyclaceae bacterium]|nr:MAG: sensor domain-containing diguanylate cyclase [Rhodocyclaceae bacterium]